MFRNQFKLVFTLLALPGLAFASGGHQDPIAPVILGVTGIMFFAILGRFAARKLGQPSVLGELVMGMLLGNVAYFFHFDLIMARQVIHADVPPLLINGKF